MVYIDEVQETKTLSFNGTLSCICSTQFQVVCRQLGLMGGMAHSNSYYGQSSGQIWLKDVSCSGSESSLGDCVVGNVFSSQINDCFHYEDASATCTGK